MPLIKIIIGLFLKKMDGACENYCFASFILLPGPPVNDISQENVFIPNFILI